MKQIIRIASFIQLDTNKLQIDYPLHQPTLSIRLGSPSSSSSSSSKHALFVLFTSHHSINGRLHLKRGEGDDSSTLLFIYLALEMSLPRLHRRPICLDVAPYSRSVDHNQKESRTSRPIYHQTTMPIGIPDPCRTVVVRSLQFPRLSTPSVSPHHLHDIPWHPTHREKNRVIINSSCLYCLTLTQALILT